MEPLFADLVGRNRSPPMAWSATMACGLIFLACLNYALFNFPTCLYYVDESKSESESLIDETRVKAPEDK